MKKHILLMLTAVAITQSAFLSAIFRFGKKEETMPAAPAPAPTGPGIIERTRQRLFGPKEPAAPQPPGVGAPRFAPPAPTRPIGVVATTRVGLQLESKRMAMPAAGMPVGLSASKIKELDAAIAGAIRQRDIAYTTYEEVGREIRNIEYEVRMGNRSRESKLKELRERKLDLEVAVDRQDYTIARLKKWKQTGIEIPYNYTPKWRNSDLARYIHQF